MTLQDGAHSRTIGDPIDFPIPEPAHPSTGWMGRFSALLQSLVVRVADAFNQTRARPVLTPRTATDASPTGPGSSMELLSLGRGGRGARGTVVRVGAGNGAAGDGAAAELERRLLEIGFVEGAAVEILHEGFIRRDPIAVRLDDMRVALRRREADAILVRVPCERPALADAEG